MRKLLSVIFVILLSTTMSAQSSGGHIVRPIQKTIQEKAIVVDGMKYKIKGNRATLIKGKDSPIISIPQYINCNGSKILVTSIGPDAFQSYKNITTVTIPNSVTSIGDCAFCFCESLTSITIPNSVKTIGDYAFQTCKSLTSITIPNSVQHIGYGFSDCVSLKYLKVEAGNKKYDSRNNCNAIIETATNTLKLGSLNTEIPNTVKIIGSYSFHHCKDLTAINIPNSITTIGDGAFNGCSKLTSITIPKSVKIIGTAAFMDCTGLKKVIIKDLTAWCSIKFGRYDSNPMYYARHLYGEDDNEIIDFVIPNGVTKIGDHVFCNYNGLNSLVISKSVKEIGGDNFYGCRENLNYIKVETGNPNYNSRNNCNAIIETATNKLILGCKNSTIPTGLVTIGAGSFSGCRKLSAITIPNSVSAIENGAFSSCSSLTSIAIPSSVKTIGQMAFSWCTALTSINIPNSVKYIGYLAFENCGFNQVRIPKETKLHSFDGEQKQRVFNDNVKIIRY